MSPLFGILSAYKRFVTYSLKSPEPRASTTDHGNHVIWELCRADVPGILSAVPSPAGLGLEKNRFSYPKLI